ncbi:MAG TPA: aminoacyl-tRNA deacylase [Candidatus Peribacter riflensis]|nr:aminoacyl-tRNA deacylase [Candidatus Peribacter riflensis]
MYTSGVADIYAFLRQNGIPFEKFEHPAVFTCEEAERLCPPMPGAHTKNLFLRDRKGTRHFLVTVGYDKQVDLKALTKVLETDKLSFASPERLMKYLGVEPGAATLLGLVADTGHAVEFSIDEALWQAEALLCHPMVNTATLVIPHAGIERFLEATGHAPRVISVPSR